MICDELKLQIDSFDVKSFGTSFNFQTARELWRFGSVKCFLNFEFTKYKYTNWPIVLKGEIKSMTVHFSQAKSSNKNLTITMLNIK